MALRTSARRAPRSIVVRLGAAFFVTVGFLLATMNPASAHAVVVSSTPGSGERLVQAPADVTITFSESVSAELGGLTVLDADGNRVDSGSTDQPQPSVLHTNLQPGLGDGTFVANYKVVSADGHPVSGAIVYTVGNAAARDVSGLKQQNDPKLETLSKLTQFVTYLGGLLAAGLAFFLAFIHDGGPERPRLARITRIATVVAAFGVASTVAVQAALTTSGSLGAVFDVTTIKGVLHEGLGWQSAVLLCGLAVCHLAVDVRSHVVSQSLAFYGGLTVTSSFVLWGHAVESSNPWLSVPADVVHVAVAATWFGGLVGLIVVLRQRSRADAGSISPALTGDPIAADGAVGGDPAEQTEQTEGELVVPGSFEATVGVVSRFSTMAMVSVAALIVAGLTLGYTLVGSISALFSTTYGTVLLIKAGLVAIILFIAAYNRFFLLPWLLEPDDDGGGAAAPGADDRPSGAASLDAEDDGEGAELADARRGVAVAVLDAPEPALDGPRAAELEEATRAGWRTLLNTVRFEALGIVAVLAITAVLVNTTPGGTAAAPGGPFQQDKPFRDGTVSLTITPNEAGSNSLHLEFIGANKLPADLAQKVTVEMSLPAKDVGPLTREMVKAGTGHFILENIPDLSIPGDWNITLVARVSEFDEERVPFTDTVT